MPRRQLEVVRLDSKYHGQGAPPPLDTAIARLAERQWGVVSRAELAKLGLSRDAIDHRLRIGRLHGLHRGVYAVGHRRTERRGRWLAAVMACGSGAVLSHRTAAALWDIGSARGARIDVTTSRRNGSASPRGVALHRVRSLPVEEVTAADGIPCTSVARTLLDLAACSSARELERACERAEMLRLFDLRAVEASLDRARGRRGARALRALLAGWTAGTTITRSRLEELFLALVRQAGLPQPRLNAPVLIGDGARHIEIDALWMPQRLAVELDGRATHGTARAFEEDRERDVALQLAGYHPARFTWRSVTDRPRGVAHALARLLETYAK